MMEAVQTTVASLAILSSERVQGFERNPVALCHEIAEQKVLERLAGRISFGHIFPMARWGFTFPSPLTNNGGKLSLSPLVVHEIQEEREKALTWPRAGNRKKGCPAAARTIPVGDTMTSGVTLLAKSMQPFFAYEYRRMN
jgi:hypothetical protein